MINIAGITIAIISTLLVVIQFICHKWTVKITKYYWFWLIIGLFLFGWFIGWRTIPYSIQYAQLLKQPGFNPLEHGSEISNALGLQVCEFSAFFLPLSLIVDPSRKIARALTPIALAGSIFVIYGQITVTAAVQWGLHYFFIGDTNNRLYVWIHVSNLLLGFGVFFNTPKHGWKGYLAFLTAVVLTYSYIGICMAITGTRTSVSGLTPSDWKPGGGYGWFARVFHTSPIASMCISFPFMFLLISLLVYLDDVVIKKFKRYQFGNARTNKWYIWNNPNVYVKE